MLKYTDTQVTFREIPDEITLCINISGCPNHCEGCHSPYLAEDIGEEITKEVLNRLINENNGVTCVCFMGGDQNPLQIWDLAKYIQTKYLLSYKIGWYSGKDQLPEQFSVGNVDHGSIDYYHIIDNKCYDLTPFNFIKLGSYKKNLGPLDKSTTNQRLYEVLKNPTVLEDITYKFWK